MAVLARPYGQRPSQQGLAAVAHTAMLTELMCGQPTDMNG